MKNYHSTMKTVRLYAAMDLWEIRTAYAHKDYARISSYQGCITNYISMGIISMATRNRYYEMWRKCKIEYEKSYGF